MVFPDFRFFQENVIPPPHVRKSNILHPKPERDYLLNLFFSKPDYEDPHKKVFYTTFLGAKVGSFMALSEVLATKVRLEHLALEVAAKRFFFIASGAIAYGSVTTAVANLRGKKDDHLNHAIGAGSLGFIYGYAKKSSGAGAAFAAFAACAGIALKYIYVHNLTVAPKFIFKGMNFIWGSEKYEDWRLVKGNAVRAYEDVPRKERYVN